MTDQALKISSQKNVPVAVHDNGKVRLGNGEAPFKANRGALPADVRDNGKVRLGNGEAPFKANRGALPSK